MIEHRWTHPSKRLALQMSQVEGLANGMARCVLDYIKRNKIAPPLRAYAIPRGGVPVLFALASVMPDKIIAVDDPDKADIIIDDIVDSGDTAKRFARQDRPVFTMFIKEGTLKQMIPYVFAACVTDCWITFPWEGSEVGSAEDIVTRLLSFIGEDPKRGGLQETPARVIKAWQEWAAGYQIEPASVLKTFEDGAEKVDEMVLVRDIMFYSHCEHHLAPFFGVAHIGYVPNKRIVGLSKFARLVDVFARRLQVQERMTNQIADTIDEALKPKGVAVVLEARHLCMESRGIKRVGSFTSTSAMKGVFMSKPEARAEFFSLIGKKT